MGAEVVVGSVVVSIRQAGESLVENLDWPRVRPDLLGSAQPWRTFRWYKGQQHYSGTYWSATMCDHVIYESRLELGRLLFADFDPSVRCIVAQPFLLKAEVDGQLRRHIPDYLLLTDSGPVVVDVKPRHRVDHSKVAYSFAWTRKVVEERGWEYEVWSEPPPAELENIRFLAGYRRDWLFGSDLLDALRAVDFGGQKLGDTFRCLLDQPRALVKAAILHLLWSGHMATDLDSPLSAGHVLRRSV